MRENCSKYRGWCRGDNTKNEREKEKKKAKMKEQEEVNAGNEDNSNVEK